MRPANTRVQTDTADAAVTTADFATAVRHFLSQQPRQLPSRFLYDPLGSALFDAICHLPWYRVTAGETRLLIGHGREILSHLHPLGRIVELGAGNGDKLAALLASAPPRTASLDLDLIDISRAALATASRALSAFDQVRVFAHESSYEDGLRRLGREPAAAGRTLMLFLGSNIGNYDPDGAAAFLLQARAALRPGDALLLGTDLVKPEADLLMAYDDPLGVTAAFNRNLLVRINRELGGDFDLDGFAHRAVWNARASRVEMHLVSTRSQRVRIRHADLEIAFHAGEHIWTESSYKFVPGTVAARLSEAGFTPRDQWIDREAQFALTLAEA
jgi:L-histidine N-alpha-methyltransferase